MRRNFLFVAACTCVLSATVSAVADVPEAVRYLKELAPQAQVMQENGRVTQAFGTAMAFGTSPNDAAERFRLDHADVFGVTADELMAEGLDGTPNNELGLMYDRATDTYKFRLFRYVQLHDGVRVFRGELRVLVRNELDYPVVLATGNVIPMSDFVVPRTATPNIDPTQSADPALDTFSDPELVIFAGLPDKPAVKGQDNSPRLAYTFIAEVSDPLAGDYQKWLYVVDAANGAVLYKENKVLLENVSGNVSANATPIPKADICTASVSTPLPYAKVSISGGSTAYADVNGDFTIPNGGTSAVTVNSPMAGLYFYVSDVFVSREDLSQSGVTPPGPANFVHNSPDSDEYIRAQINGYIQANVVRDFALTYSPSYPVIATQTNFPVVVNRADGYCPGNAWYDGAALNLCRSGSGYPNTAFSNVIHHEYGHHLVESGGSGQDQYGEGMSDCIALLIADDPILGYGFTGNCSTGIRTASNSYVYPCTGEGHDCGQLISGCVWSTRNELAANYPGTYLDILSALTVNSIPLHGASSTITPAITTHFLTLDDDDSDLGNGTPHSPEILAGFGAHNMVPGPAPDNDYIANATEACPGTYTGSTSSATPDGASSCGDADSSPDVWFVYTPETNGTLTASLCSGTTYDSVISIHSGSPATAGNTLDCDDDGCGSTGGPSTASASVTAGNTYYIRVTGWSGSAGDYSLTISGPNCAVTQPLYISLPNGAPETANPAGTTFDVQIDNGTEVYQSGSATLHYRYDGGSYLTASLADLGGGAFEATLPGGACGETAEFFISADSTVASTVTSPSDAPSTVYDAPVGTLTVIMDDNFETDMGWTTENTGATAGQWQRGVPVNDPSWAYDPASDSDGSGQCWLTQNETGNTDVDGDGGVVRLISPTMDFSAGGDIEISYDYYLYLSVADGIDWLKVDVSDDDGGTWVNVVTHDTNGSLSWRSNVITQNDLDTAGLTMTSTMKVRYRARDNDAQSIVEAGVDAFRVTSFDCASTTPCPGDLDGSQSVDLTDLGILLGQYGCTSSCSADLSGDDAVDLTDLGLLLGLYGTTCP